MYLSGKNNNFGIAIYRKIISRYRYCIKLSKSSVTYFLAGVSDLDHPQEKKGSIVINDLRIVGTDNINLYTYIYIFT